MIKNLDILADRLKGIKVNDKDITVEDLKTFITSEDEVEIKTNKLNLLSDAELEDVKESVRKSTEGDSLKSKNDGYVDGMKSGVEQTVKAFKNTNGLEFEGKIKYAGDGKIDFDETAKHVSTNFKEKILSDSKIEPNKRIKELEESNSKIQKTYEKEKNEWEKSEQIFNKKISSLKEDNFLHANLPKVEGLTKSQFTTLFKSDGYGVNIDENGKESPTRWGKPVLDKMEKPVSFSTVAADYIAENEWNKKPAGRSMPDQIPTKPKFKTKNEAFAHMEKNKIDIRSKEGQYILENISQD